MALWKGRNSAWERFSLKHNSKVRKIRKLPSIRDLFYDDGFEYRKLIYLWYFYICHVTHKGMYGGKHCRLVFLLLAIENSQGKSFAYQDIFLIAFRIPLAFMYLWFLRSYRMLRMFLDSFILISLRTLSNYLHIVCTYFWVVRSWILIPKWTSGAYLSCHHCFQHLMYSSNFDDRFLGFVGIHIALWLDFQAKSW